MQGEVSREGPGESAAGPRARRREGAAAAVVLALAFLLAHAHALPPGRVLCAADLALVASPFAAERGAAERPRNQGLWDQALQFGPWFAFDSREAARGSLPLWNPHSGCGAAHAGNDQVALDHPLRRLAVLLGPASGLFLLAAARHVLAGLGLFLFLRRVGLGFAGSLFGGVAFAFSGFLVVWQGSPHSAVAATLGWALLGIERATAARGLRPSATLALATAFALWGGHAETALHVGLAAFALALGRGVSLGRSEGRGAVVRLLARLLGSVALGVGLAAPHVLAVASELGASEALAHRTTASVQWWLPARFLALIPFPDLYGNPRDGTTPASPVQSYLELAGAGTGASAVALALAGALGPWSERATRIATVALVAAAVALAFATGAPGFAALAQVAPLSLARNHRLVLVAAAAVCVAAGAGVELVVERKARPLRAGIAFACVVGLAFWVQRSFGSEVASAVADDRGRPLRGAVFALLGPALAATAALAVAGSTAVGGFGRRGAGALLVACVLLEQAVVFAGGWNPSVARADFFPASPTVDALARAPEGDRARTLVLGDLLVLPPEVPTAYGVDLVGRYDALGSRTFSPLRDALGPVPAGQVPECFQRVDPRIARILGVRRFVVGQPELDPRLAWDDLAPLPEKGPWALVDASGRTGEVFRTARADIAALLLQVRLEGTRAASLEVALASDRGGVARVASTTVVRRAGDLVAALFLLDPAEPAAGATFQATLRRLDRGAGQVYVAAAPWPAGAIGTRLEEGRRINGQTLVGSVAATSSFAASLREVPGLAARVLEDEAALPRARVVGQAEVAATVAEGLARLRDARHDPRESVVLLGEAAGPGGVQPGDVPAGEVAPVASGAPDAGSAAIERYEPDAVTVRARAPQGGGWLVLADAWHPGWSATVDGREARVLRADVGLRAVRLPPGEHAVVFRFRPPGAAPGLALAALALALLGVTVLRARRES